MTDAVRMLVIRARGAAGTMALVGGYETIVEPLLDACRAVEEEEKARARMMAEASSAYPPQHPLTEKHYRAEERYGEER